MTRSVRNPDSAPGDWYVDTACIDCGASRHVAPELIVERNGKSVFARQPNTQDEQAGGMARCTGVSDSIRTQRNETTSEITEGREERQRFRAYVPAPERRRV